MKSKRKATGREATNNGAGNLPPCPYCSRLGHFQGALTGEPERTEENTVFYVGKFWDSEARKRSSAQYEVFSDHYRIQASSKQFIKRFSGFHLTMIGFRYSFEESKPLEIWRFTHLNSSPFFSYLEPQMVNPEKPYVFFPICRVTHKKSGVIIDGHVWPTHGLIITSQNFGGGTLSSDEVKAANEALEFFRAETRGGGQKIEEASLIQAIQKFGKKAAQTKVAAEVDVSLATLQRWIARKGQSWEELKSEYLTTGLAANGRLLYAPPLSFVGLREIAADPNLPAAKRKAAQDTLDEVNRILSKG